MATIQEAFKAILTNNALLVAAVPAARHFYIWAGESPTLPFLTVQKIGLTREQVVSARVDLVEARFAVEVFDTTAAGVQAKATLITEALEAFKGTSAGVPIRNIELEDEQDLIQEEIPAYRISQTWRLFFSEV